MCKELIGNATLRLVAQRNKPRHNNAMYCSFMQKAQRFVWMKKVVSFLVQLLYEEWA